VRRLALVVVVAFLSLILYSHVSYGSYTVTNLNTTVTLLANTSAEVTEVLTVQVSNQSVQQYTTDRAALNLTLEEWQSLIGPTLTQHIINPEKGVFNFRFLPGALVKEANGGRAYLLMSYYVLNVTSISRLQPREFLYTFRPSTFNFEHGVSGEVLPSNTTLTIVLPSGSSITSIYPIPDAPASGITNNYANVSRASWFFGEPLSKFELTFTITESLQTEVLKFFSGVYAYLGIFSFIIIALFILLFIIYAYVKASR
jgi:hypothetical protein